MPMFGEMIERLKANPKKIVFTEGSDPRILEASSRLLAGYFLEPILVGNPQEIQAASEEAGYNIRGAKIIDPENYEEMDEMVAELCELRKSKGMTPEEALKILRQGNYFGTMLVKMGKADALLGGATYSPLILSAPLADHQDQASEQDRVFLLHSGPRLPPAAWKEVLAMGDCAININPTEDDLVEIAYETANCARTFGVDPKVAFLSYSTYGLRFRHRCGQDASTPPSRQRPPTRPAHRRRDPV